MEVEGGRWARLKDGNKDEGVYSLRGVVGI